MTVVEREQKLWAEIGSINSPSHDKTHLERVIANSKALQVIYGGDWELIEAAAILHDLGRADKGLRGKESAHESALRARPILVQAGFPEEKINPVCQIIAEHDQPEVKPSTIEGRILKEADFLDGFGARGILRSLLWAGERGESSEEVLRRLREKMPARIASLEFPESRAIAERQYRFVGLFLSLLEEPACLEAEQRTGKYIIIEGISGSGKDTQARMLADWFQGQGAKVRLVSEPTPDTKPVLAKWRSEVDDPEMELFFYTADRKRIMEKEVLPALRAGEIVLSVRSWVSTLVYEAKTKQDEALVAFLHTFVPKPDLIVWLDVEPEEAMERIRRRYEEEGKPFSKFEKLTKLRSSRDRYEHVLRGFENVVRIDGSPSPELIHQRIASCYNISNEKGC